MQVTRDMEGNKLEIRKMTCYWASWKGLDLLDLLGLVSNFCDNFSSAPDTFARSSSFTTDSLIYSSHNYWNPGKYLGEIVYFGGSRV